MFTKRCLQLRYERRNNKSFSNKRQLFNHTLEILRYWAEMDFKGWDVYDGLNSKLFKASPFYKSSF